MQFKREFFRSTEAILHWTIIFQASQEAKRLLELHHTALGWINRGSYLELRKIG